MRQNEHSDEGATRAVLTREILREWGTAVPWGSAIGLCEPGPDSTWTCGEGWQEVQWQGGSTVLIFGQDVQWLGGNSVLIFGSLGSPDPPHLNSAADSVDSAVSSTPEVPLPRELHADDSAEADLEWFYADPSRVRTYLGQYVAVFDRAVVGAGTAKEAYEQALQGGVDTPLLIHVHFRDPEVSDLGL